MDGLSLNPTPSASKEERPLKRVLVTGAGGMLGRAAVEELRSRGYEVLAATRADLDLGDPMAAAKLATGEFGSIDAVVNCAAYTAVDKAEAEPQAAFDANGLGVSYLGTACREIGASLIHVSTDFVFDGQSPEPYVEDAPTNPLSEYGKSKLYGERMLAGNARARIVRTAWLYGEGKCFPLTMLNAHRAGKSLRVVADQKGNPTYVPDLARTIVDLLERDAFPGIYHAVGPETTTWHDFAIRAIRAATGETPDIAPVGTSDYPTPAVRPPNSALADTKMGAIGILPMRPLDEALSDWAARLVARDTMGS